MIEEKKGKTACRVCGNMLEFGYYADEVYCPDCGFKTCLTCGRIMLGGYVEGLEPYEDYYCKHCFNA